MRLQDAARRFDRLSCYDGYTGAALFHAQLGLYDDTKRDSESSERRVLSMDAANVLPARRVVLAADRRWIIGKGNPDSHDDHTIRVGYVVHEATHLATRYTLGQLCRAEAGTTAWGGRAWVKDLAFSEQSSHLTPLSHFNFAATEVGAEAQVILFDGVYCLVRSVQRSAAGFLIMSAEDMESPIDLATFAGATYDPVSETYSGSPTAVRAIRARWQGLFRYRSSLAPAFGPEDVQLAIAKTLYTPKPGQKFTLLQGTWSVQAVADEGDVWLCRASRHATA